MLFITHDNPNYLYSEEPELLEYTRDWLDKVISASPRLGDPGQTESYFDKLDGKRRRVERRLGF
jgi:hypothetical protein